MEKKDGGNISHWQFHHLKYNDSLREEFEELAPNVDFDNIIIVTGTIVDESIGRWRPGYYFRSSMIIDIDRDKNIIETENIIYHFDPKTENQDSIPNLGNVVLKIFYKKNRTYIKYK